MQILRQGEVVALVNVKSGLGLWLEFAVGEEKKEKSQ